MTGRTRRILRWGGGAALVLGLVLAGAALAWLGRAGLAPRQLVPYIEKRTSGHNPAIVGLGTGVARVLLALDRGSGGAAGLVLPPDAAVPRPGDADSGRAVMVSTVAALRTAVDGAQPGDVITLAPGTYRLQGRSFPVTVPGRPGAPITVRARRPGDVTIELDMLEGFLVEAPYWRFENLTIRGTCGSDDYCEHAFHVVGAGHHFESVGNTIADFNAHFKVNGWQGQFPDDGLVERNQLVESRARATVNPVVLIDLVGASGWTVRANLISDFIKAGGDMVSYGAYFKGGGGHNVFERNVVWCERTLRDQPGERIGLSLGGGGTGPEFCRDGRCITEQDDSVLRANLIVGCSDVGIYLNSAAATKVYDNTLLDTIGIDVRFPSSSALLDGNLVDGRIHARDGGMLHLGDNVSTPLWRTYLGSHPVRGLFKAPLAGDFAWRGAAPPRAEHDLGERPAQAADLCGRPRPMPAAYGAFARIDDCRPAP